MYEIDDDALNQLTNFLANFNTFQLNEIMYAIDPRMTNAQYENLLCQGIPDILGQATLIDSVLASHASDAELSQGEASLREILNKLFCLCIICRNGDPNDPRVKEVRHMWFNYATAIQSLYLRNLIREVPFDDLSLYRASYHRSEERRHMSYHDYAMAKHREKVQYYIGNDAILYALIFRLNQVPPDYTCPISVGDLISPPTSQLEVVQPLNAAGYVSNPAIRQQPLPIGHINRNLEVRSVKIFADGTVVPNPDGYPDIPPTDNDSSSSDSSSDSDDVQIVGGRAAPQRRRTNRGGSDNQDRPQGRANNAEVEVHIYDYETAKPLPHQGRNIRLRFFDLPTTPIQRYAELGVVWINQKSRSHDVVIVLNRNQAEILKKFKLCVYGIYSPSKERSEHWGKLKPYLQNEHNFAKHGNPGIGLYDHFPWHMRQCHEYGCMEDVPAATHLREASVFPIH